MNRPNPFFFIAAALALASSPAVAQITLNTSPASVIGQDSVTVTGFTPNLVEGRELDTPLGIALDMSANPPHLYIADTGNNRVLGYANATSFSNGQTADIVIGQPDLGTTLAQGPNRGTSPRQTGLTSPVGLAVDSGGNLYVADCGNNRILRFPQPFAQTSIFPNMVIGQNDFTTNASNLNGIGAATLSFNPSGSAFAAYLTFDAAGNLWVADAGNNRVLSFPQSALTAGISGPSATIVIGQPNFTTNSLAGYTLANLSLIFTPTGIAFDGSGNLFVSESVNFQDARILVFTSPFQNGQSAIRTLGVPSATPSTTVNAEQIGPSSGALFTVNGSVAIADSTNNRVLFFNPIAQWTSDMGAQPAAAVLGQASLTTGAANQGQAQASATSFSSPNAAVYSGTELFVADSLNHRVLALPQSGTTFGPATNVIGQTAMNFDTVNLIEGRELDIAPGNGQANAGMAIDLNSTPPHLYVADTYNNRVLGYNDVRAVHPGVTADIVIGQPDFQHSEVNYPTNNSTPNQSGLSAPIGVAVDVNGNLYVADSGNSRILRFSQPFAGTPQNLPDADIVIGQSSFTIKITDPSPTTMSSPYGLAFTGDNGLFASDSVHNRVLFFPGSAANFKTGMAATLVFGEPDFVSTTGGGGNSELSYPHHIATDSSSRLYVADTGNSRISIFDDAPAAASGAEAAVTLVGLNNPEGVYVNPTTGEIWEADTNTGQCFRYPNFDNLTLDNYASNFTIPDQGSPVAITQDASGALYVADTANRVVIYFPGVAGLNAANYLGPCVPNESCDTQSAHALAPGTIVSLFSLSGQAGYFGSTTMSFNQLPNPLPLPTTLADTQVLVNGIAAPIYFVSPSQINFLMPNDAPTSGTATITVVNSSTGQVLGSSQIAMAPSSPGIFTATATGSGQAAVLNQDYSVNGPNNPAPWNSVVSFYGTGAGMVPGAPPDGSPATGVTPTSTMPQVAIGAQFVPAANILYSGLAPGLVGVWQVNVKIPSSVAPTTSTSPTPVFFLLNSIPSGGPTLDRPVTMWVTSN
jgi:uncharacterized protein (TIGR03437 family)